MITIHLTYFAILREKSGKSEETLQTSCSTPRELFRQLTQQYDWNLPLSEINVAINDVYTTMDEPLKENDRVVYIPPVAGG